MSMIPDERSMGSYLTRHDLIERIAAQECALTDGPSLRSRLSCMSTFELFSYAKAIGISIKAELVVT